MSHFFFFFPVIAIFDATLFCDDFDSSSFSYSNVTNLLISSLQVFGTFTLLVCTIMKLGHRITYGNREAVNTKKKFFFEQHDPTTILSFLSFFILSQSDPAQLIIIILFIFIFFIILSQLSTFFFIA